LEYLGAKTARKWLMKSTPVVVFVVAVVDVNAKKFGERHKIYGTTFITFSLSDPPTLLAVFVKFNYFL
jgi:hypothetical protein